MPLSDHMSRWAQYRERYTRRKNAFLLLTLSGTIRSADVELAYCRERLATGTGRRQCSALDGGREKQSIWAMDLRQLFLKRAYRQPSKGSK